MQGGRLAPPCRFGHDSCLIVGMDSSGVERNMERETVESSVVRSVGHSRVIEIEFESGRVYQYMDVPEDVYEGMLAAESKGKYFNKYIRGKYPYQEIELKTPRQKTAQK